MGRMKELYEEAMEAKHDEMLAEYEKLKLYQEADLELKRASARAKQAQYQGAALATMIVIAVLTVMLNQFGFLSDELSGIKLIVSLAIPALGICATLVYFYLRGWVTKVGLPTKHVKDSDFASLLNRVEALEAVTPLRSNASSGQIYGPSPTAADVAQLLLPDVAVEMTKLFEERYERKSAEHLAAAANARRFDAAVTRLELEIKEQGRKGSVNLVIGLFTTGLAITLLIGMVFQAHGPFDSMPQIVSHYVPWLSVTIFIEVFSFFFLRLYKATLAEARRYNDDLTRLTLQWVATDTGRFSVEPTAIAALAKDLIDVSKPPKLASAESGKPNIDTDKAFKALLDVLSKQLDAKSKKSAKPESKDDEDD